jgi:hypothetical protein
MSAVLPGRRDVAQPHLVANRLPPEQTPAESMMVVAGGEPTSRWNATPRRHGLQDPKKTRLDALASVRRLPMSFEEFCPTRLSHTLKIKRAWKPLASDYELARVE